MKIKKMKAAILAETAQDLIIDEVELPPALEIGQVLVKIHYSGICGSQMGEIDALKGPDKYLPHLLGHEGSGTVIEIGPGVTQLKKQDSVVLHWRAGAGIQANPAKYTWKNKPLNAGWITTFNEYAIVSENRCTPIPKETPMDQAALLGCAVTTALGALSKELHLMPGDSLVVFGVGGVGQAMIQAARLMGACPIIAVDLHEEKLSLATELGADFTFNGHTKDLEDQLRKMSPAQGYDHTIDNTGLSSIIQMAYTLTSKAGNILLLGVPSPQDLISIDTLPIHFGKSLIGSHGGNTEPTEDIPRYLRLLRHQRIDWSPLISEVIPLDNINLALKKLRQGSVNGRSLIRFEP